MCVIVYKIGKKMICCCGSDVTKQLPCIVFFSQNIIHFYIFSFDFRLKCDPMRSRKLKTLKHLLMALKFMNCFLAPRVLNAFQLLVGFPVVCNSHCLSICSVRFLLY